MQSNRRVLIIIPTYNEAENIPLILDGLFRLSGELSGRELAVLVVDDGSPDGTAALVREIAASGRAGSGGLFLLERRKKEGLAWAYLAGFQWGLDRGYDLLVEMDADLSHDPRDLPRLLAAADSHDFAVGSRYVRGGAIEGWGMVRRCLSLGGSLYARLLLGAPIRDMTGGFNVWRADALRKLRLEKLVSSGYVFQIELKARALTAGLMAAEVPITFRDRVLGESKMTAQIAAEAIRGVLALRRELGRRSARLLPRSLERIAESTLTRFAVVGSLGTVTNAALFYATVDKARLSPTVGALCGFAVAVSQNYLLNQRWTFGGKGWVSQLSWGRYLKFIASSTGALAVNLVVLHVLIHLPLFGIKTIPQVIGILSGAALNYIASRYFVFLRRAL